MSSRSNLVEKLKSLTIENISYIYRGSLREAIRPFYRNTINLVKKQFKSNKGFFKFNQEIRYSTNFDKSAGEYRGKIFINPQGALKWFELGTEDRYIKKKGETSRKKKETSKKGYRGKINAKYVFSRYTDSWVKNAGDKALSLIDTKLQKEFDK